MLVRCVRGLEWIVADEMTAVLGTVLPATAPRELRAVVPAGRALLSLRTADDVFVVVGETPDHGHRKDAVTPLAADVAGLDWSGALGAVREVRGEPLPPAPTADVVASFRGRRNFNRYAVEDAVGSVLGSVAGASYRSRTPSAGGAARDPGPTALTVRVFLDGVTTHVAVRAAARPLHRRAYKLAAGPGTLHPPLAAAMVRMVGAGHRLLHDPFCGDGTVAVEAASAGAASTVLASDIDRARVAGARDNADRAGMRVALAVADAGRAPVGPGSVDALVTNPPWDLAVRPEGSLARSWSPFWRASLEALAPDGVGCLVADDATDPLQVLEEQGLALGAQARVRLAGRLSRVVSFAPSGPPRLAAGLEAARARAAAQGLVDQEGF